MKKTLLIIYIFILILISSCSKRNDQVRSVVNKNILVSVEIDSVSCSGCIYLSIDSDNIVFNDIRSSESFFFKMNEPFLFGFNKKYILSEHIEIFGQKIDSIYVEYSGKDVLFFVGTTLIVLKEN